MARDPLLLDEDFEGAFRCFEGFDFGTALLGCSISVSASEVSVEDSEDEDDVSSSPLLLSEDDELVSDSSDETYSLHDVSNQLVQSEVPFVPCSVQWV